MRQQKKNCENLIVRNTELIRYLVAPYVVEGDQVVDATCGNGYDTLMLRRLVGDSGVVYAFDIQEMALEKSKERLSEAGFSGEGIHWILDSHGNMDQYVEAGKPSVILFNLGYLPGGSREIQTTAAESAAAVEKAASLIRRGGLVAVTVYPGHAEGRREQAALYQLLGGFPSKEFHVLRIEMLNQKEAKVRPPEILLITKK